MLLDVLYNKHNKNVLRPALHYTVFTQPKQDSIYTSYMKHVITEESILGPFSKA